MELTVSLVVILRGRRNKKPRIIILPNKDERYVDKLVNMINAISGTHVSFPDGRPTNNRALKGLYLTIQVICSGSSLNLVQGILRGPDEPRELSRLRLTQFA